MAGKNLTPLKLNSPCCIGYLDKKAKRRISWPRKGMCTT